MIYVPLQGCCGWLTECLLLQQGDVVAPRVTECVSNKTVQTMMLSAEEMKVTVKRRGGIVVVDKVLTVR